ncbi:membrane-bound lytic murein transglycosylase F [Desulfonatronum thiosulfatophilum]|uniref:Membrane-bound lytic murein transglycosylase F n=1 Tax=Desulfonatronum thiosulfatophilum TaxID=617002 RepID=A0A1G6A304_9BACT|nr:transglycosylase SLT domain-containing protein [Desulfonatronum thiosulfatophilum]SDB02373.1 membrane-bound lytic murein transglycosylase F [Desulfonatronum thiosulfatophilum]
MKNIVSTLPGPRARLLIFLLVFVQLILVNNMLWNARPPGLIAPVIRVLAPESELVHSQISPYGPGLERELVELFAEQAGMHPVWIHMDSAGAAWDELSRHRADLLVGAGYAPPRHLLDVLVAPVSAGPTYARHSVGVVHQRNNQGSPDLSDLCAEQLLLPENTLLRQTYARLLDDLACTTPALFTNEGSLPVQFAAMVESDARYTLVDTGRFTLWEPFYADLQLADSLDASLEYRWFWRGDHAGPAKHLERFWKTMITDSELTRIQDKYLGFLPDRSDHFALRHFLETLQRELPRYSKTILKAAERHEIDPLLLIALIYHESMFDASAVSRTGVRGIMQITQATAQALGLDDPMNPTGSIMAGAAYLRQLWDRLDRPDIAEWDRWFLALSAYNQGLGHTWDAMRLAGEFGLVETSWNDVKTVFPLLSQQEYFSRARHGYTRGFEAVAHVEAIRYYYYILHGLFVLERPEGKHLGRLGFAPFLS